MKVKNLASALFIVQKLMSLKLPIEKAYDLYILAKQIKDKKDFFIIEEKKIINRFNVSILENGELKFKSEEDQDQFYTEHDALLNYEVKDISSIELKLEDLKEVKFSAFDISALEGVINFTY